VKLGIALPARVVIAAVMHTLDDLPAGQEGVLGELRVADEIGARLMEMGFVPGAKVVATHSAPSGDPRVFQVDGSAIALRRETARRLILRPPSPTTP
jgi:Fe2+ transport system protein FeoA